MGYPKLRTLNQISNRKKEPPWANQDGYQTSVTLPETNIAPENEPLEKEIPIGNHHF